MRRALAIVLAVTATSAIAKSVPPPEPPSHPNYTQVAQKGRDQIISTLVDPGSAVIVWTSGFQWGFMKPIIGKRHFGWIACGTVNAKNRMGGYAGAEGFLIFVDEKGTITSAMQSDWVSTCDDGPFVSVQPELVNYDPSSPKPVGAVGVGAEIEKLAELRDKGVITQAEFEAQKAKLLGR